MANAHTLLRMAFNRVSPKASDDPVFALRVIFLFVVAFAVTRGWRFTFDREPLPMGVQLISGNDPQIGSIIWGSLWFAAALVALLGVFWAWPFASVAVVGLSLPFALGYTLSWINAAPHTPQTADYANAGTYWFVIGVLTFGYPLSRRALRANQT